MRTRSKTGSLPKKRKLTEDPSEQNKILNPHKNLQNLDVQIIEKNVSSTSVQRQLLAAQNSNKQLKSDLEKSVKQVKDMICRMIAPSYPLKTRKNKQFIKYGPSFNPHLQPASLREKDLLLEAIYTNNTLAIEYLFQHRDKFDGVSADLAEYNNRKWKPLVVAAIAGYYECGKLLIENGADVNVSYRSVAPNCLYDLIDLKDKFNYDFHEDEFPEMDINYKWEGLEKFAKLLMSKGIALNNQDFRGMTVLHEAIHHKDMNCVKFAELFIKNGADVNIKTIKTINQPTYNPWFYRKRFCMFEQTPLHFAIRYGRCQGYTGDSKMMKKSAIQIPKNRDKIVKLLLENGADPELCDEQGNTFLHYVAAHGLVQHYYESKSNSMWFKFHKLLNNGANKKNNFGDTPLIFALQLNWDQDESRILDTVKRLYFYGANLNCKNDFGYTPLLISKLRNLTSVTSYLVENGAVIGDISKNRLAEIIESYCFDRYPYESGYSHYATNHTKSSCEYLKALANISLGRFSNEYSGVDLDVEMHENPHLDINQRKIRQRQFSSYANIASVFIDNDSELKDILMNKISNGRIFKEDVCVVCMTDEAEKTFLPCGHQAVCKGCCAFAGFEECPICKLEIKIIL